MAVGQGYDLLKLLECRLCESCDVDIAVARAAPCPAIDKLGAFCAGGGLLRVVVGIDGSATDPAALRQLAGFGQLRVGVGAAASVLQLRRYWFHRGAGARSGSGVPTSPAVGSVVTTG